MQVPVITTDIVVIISLISGALVGWLGGRHRLRLVILSVYVGIVLAQQLSQPLASLTHLPASQAAWLLLGLPILVFGLLGGRHHKPVRGHDHKGPAIANLIVGILTGALVLAAAFMLMPLRDQSLINGGSFLATELAMARLWLLGLMPVAALLLGFMKHEGGHH